MPDNGDTYAAPLRSFLTAIFGGTYATLKGSRSVEKAGFEAGESLNHILVRLVLSYASNPDATRELLLSWLRKLPVFGLWSAEQGSGSHCAHYYSALDALLALALFFGDQEMVAAVLPWIAGNHALESLCANRDIFGHAGDHYQHGRVVIPGGRCWIGDASTGDADQRVIRNLRWQHVDGYVNEKRRPVRWPRNAGTSGDWTGPWCLQQLDACKATWCASWPKLRAQIASCTTLPPLANALEVVRVPGGHQARLLTSAALEHPALWARDVAGVESYGCKPEWGKSQVVSIADFPPPAIASGSVVRAAGLRAAA